MAKYTIDFDDKNVKAGIRAFRNIHEIVIKAYNKSVTDLKKVSTNIVFNRYNLDKPQIKKRIRGKKARVTGSGRVGASMLSSSKRALTLYPSFGATQGATGLKFQIERGKHRLEHGFIAPSKQGNKLSFARGGKGQNLVPRYPIYAKRGISVPVMLGDERTERFLKDKRDEILDRNLEFYARKKYKAYIKEFL